MLNNIFQPYHTMQEINLDWILTKVKNILRFVPDDGAVGQILRRTAHGAEWSNEQGGGGAVDSVNGQTGTVVLTASDVGALPDTYSAPVDSVNGQTGTVVLGKSDVGLGNVANVLQYSSSNPPPYPVTSVNSQTGAVTLSIPTDTGDLTNGAGFVTAAGAAAAAPVQSVNGQTGAVVLPTDTFELGETVSFAELTACSWSNSSGVAGTVGLLLNKKIPRSPVSITAVLECRYAGSGQLASSVQLSSLFVAGSYILPLVWQVPASFGANNSISLRFSTLTITF